MNPPATILIIDDSATDLKLLRAQLEAEGFSVLDAGDGVAAFATLEREKVDAVITDILMPRMDGFAFCREIRKSELFCALPLVVYTGTYLSPADEKMAYLAGADKYLTKPSPWPLLLEVLREIQSDGKYRSPRPGQPQAEAVVMREYNVALVQKLEKKILDLEESRSTLARTHEQLQARSDELARLNAELEHRVTERTGELMAANQELEAFGHSLSHDLQAPLRQVKGYALVLQEDCADKLDAPAQAHIGRIIRLTVHMNQLVSDMLRLAKVKATEVRCQTVDLSALALGLAGELEHAHPERQVDWAITPELAVQGDEALLRIALDNLLRNAWKFTGKSPRARIEFGAELKADEMVCHVRDNGVGFDMADQDRLFEDFQRLHNAGDFPGTGLGLATVRRVIERHGGRVWATGAVNQGATFYFTLPPAAIPVAGRPAPTE